MKKRKVLILSGIIILLLLSASVFYYFQEDLLEDALEPTPSEFPQADFISPFELPPNNALIQSPDLAPSFPYDSIGEGIRMMDKQMFRNLSHLFEQAHHDNSSARILYMGDSQLEGDFLATQIRECFQKKYGGKGSGLIAADKYYSSHHQISVDISKNWKLSERMKIKRGNKSLLFRHASLTKKDGTAWIKINRLQALRLADDYRQLRLFFVSPSASHIKIKNQGQVISDIPVSGAAGLRTIRLEFESTPSKLEIEIDTEDYFELDCLSLDCSQGVYVDNIPLRGKASPLFSISDTTAMQGMCQMLQPDLFILQFGANAIKYTHENNISLFRQQTIEQIKLIQQWCPKAEVLLVSVSDIAHQTDTGLVSYDNIPQLKAVQYEIAMQYGCAFWDLEHYISQEGGIVKWATTSPSLARSDYLHFTKYGARKVGSKLSELLINELEK
ncbi:MAG: hypothetical protein ACK5LR_06085 [Mangrovibacterium sp.]